MADESASKDIVLRLTKAFTEQDRETITELLAEDCVWRVPGRAPVSGDYHGRSAIFAFFGKLKRTLDEPARFEVIDVGVSDDRVMLYQWGIMTIDGREIRLKEMLVFTVRDGKVVDLDEFQSDQHGFDEAFSGA